MRYLGVDLHTNSFTVCYKDETSEQISTFNLQKDLDKFIATLQPTDEVGVEATGNTAFFKKKIAPHVKRVVVVAPGQFDIIRKSVCKTDKHDARAIALFLSKGMLPEARLKDEVSTQIASMIQTREQLMKTRVALINKMHSLLNRHGIKATKESLTSTKGFEKAVAAHQWTPMEQVEINVIRSTLVILDQNLKTITKEIEVQAEPLKGFQNLKSIKGIGALSSAIFLTVIGDIDDFDKPEQLASYFGIVPTVSQSNQSCKTGRITKRGSRIGRRTLIQCTWIAIRYSPYLGEHYERLKKKKGPGKAIVATAHTLLNTIFYTLKKDWIFEDFPSFTKMAA